MSVSMKALAVLFWSLNRATCRLISSTDTSRSVTGATLGIHPPGERNVAGKCSIGKALRFPPSFHPHRPDLESTRWAVPAPRGGSGEKLDGAHLLRTALATAGFSSLA